MNVRVRHNKDAGPVYVMGREGAGPRQILRQQEGQQSRPHVPDEGVDGTSSALKREPQAWPLFAEVSRKLLEQNKAVLMQTPNQEAGLGIVPPPASDHGILDQIHALSVESVELLRSLVQMLLPRAEPRTGPSLEELLAALLASQRDQTVMLRQIGADIAALHAKLPGGDADQDADGLLARPNGRHHS